jgi:hypothetical protein
VSLQVWQSNGWLVSHKTSHEEIAALLAIADRDIAASQTSNLVADWRFAIAYNAILQLGVAALAAAGYRAERANQHYRVIQSLSLTLQCDVATLRKLDAFRRKRNLADYERAGLVSESEVQEAIAAARHLRQQVEAWVRSEHPHLLP